MRYYTAIQLFEPLSLEDDPRGILSTPFHPGGVVLKTHDQLWVGRVDGGYENSQYVNGAETLEELYINNIERTKKELWSTHWMDVTFDSKIGCPLDKSQHFVYHEMSPLKHIRHQQAIFTFRYLFGFRFYDVVITKSMLLLLLLYRLIYESLVGEVCSPRALLKLAD